MNLIFKSFSAVTLGLSALTASASPIYLITHNNTPEESNAYIAGVPSAYPTPPISTQKVYWNLVKMACYGHTTGKQCTAIIKMATNTPNPIEVGEVRMDLDSGDINPKYLSKNGYIFFVNGLGEATINKG